MKLMIASDLHGSAYYTRVLLNAMVRENPDKLLLLGDLLYHGPRNDLPRDYAPKKVIEMLNCCRGKLLCVRGNCDAEVDQMVLDFPILAEYAVLYINGLTIYAVHGHKNMDLPTEEKALIVSGHTHIPAIYQENRRYYANPGSAAIPKKESCHGYMLLEGLTLTHKALEAEERENVLQPFTFSL